MSKRRAMERAEVKEQVGAKNMKKAWAAHQAKKYGDDYIEVCRTKKKKKKKS